MRVRAMRDATAATASCRYAVSFLPCPAGAEGRSVRSGKEGEVGEGTGRKVSKMWDGWYSERPTFGWCLSDGLGGLLLACPTQP